MPADERTGRDVLDEHREEEAAGDADDDHRRRQQQRHQGGGQHPRNDKRLNRVDAHHSHRVDLLADGARAEVGAHRGGTRAGDDQHRHHRADLGDRAERGAGAGEVGGAEFDAAGC